ncbi:MAG: hypothetical protein IH849_09065 [Acidobacteria bacterium]|nr:hypothetical protein [Acidobacteriota bacterium]
MDILRRYLFLYTRHRRSYLLGGVFLIATNAIVLTIPRIFGWAIDDLEAGASRGLVLSYAAAIIALAALQTVMRVGSRIFVLSVSRRIDYEIKGMLHDHLVRLAPSFFGATNTGDLMSRMTNDVMLVRALGGPGVLYFFSAVILYALGIVYMVSISWRLTLVVFLPLPIVALLVRVLVHRVRDYVTKARIALSDLNTMVQENLAGVMVVKSFGLEEAQIERFEKQSAVYMDFGLREAWTRAQMIPVVGLGGGLALVGVIGFGARMVAAGNLSIGDLVAFMSYVGVMVMPTVALGWILSLVQRGAAALERLDEVLEQRHRRLHELDGRFVLRDRVGGSPDVQIDGPEIGPGRTVGGAQLNDLVIDGSSSQVVIFSVGANALISGVTVDGNTFDGNGDGIRFRSFSGGAFGTVTVTHNQIINSTDDGQNPVHTNRCAISWRCSSVSVLGPEVTPPPS